MPELGKEKSLLVAESNDRLFDRKNLYGIKQQKRYERLIREINLPHCTHIEKTKYWTMPELGKEKSLLVAESNDRLFDRKNLYGIKQQKRYERLIRDDTNVESVVSRPDDCSPRRSVDKEKDYILSDYCTTGDFQKYERDEVHVPTVYKNYFSRRTNKDLYVRHKYSEEYRKRNSRFPTCARGTGSGSHFCDVLGKRFCKCCEEYSNRLFSWKYERRKLLPIHAYLEY
ncbi:uncharacterized protein [Haliotis asinina]|uniref:uncharacterized protein n=1 Tax=Haliotis asinina TaxID=109174 RepID=UPI003531C0F5